MKERPIIFDGESVRAILSGAKTQTRRPIKPQPGHRVFWNPVVYRGYAGWTDEHGRPCPCPYGRVGERLWVREAWRMVGWTEDLDGASIGYRTDGCCLWRESPDSEGWENWILREIERFSRLPGVTLEDGQHEICDKRAIPWRSPIHMPRWASRITLEITDVRAERVQDITEADAIAEGLVKWIGSDGVPHYGATIADVWEVDPRRTYARRWDAVNKRRGFGWDTNCWVWVVEFRRVTA